MPQQITIKMNATQFNKKEKSRSTIKYQKFYWLWHLKISINYSVLWCDSIVIENGMFVMFVFLAALAASYCRFRFSSMFFNLPVLSYTFYRSLCFLVLHFTLLITQQYYIQCMNFIPTAVFTCCSQQVQFGIMKTSLYIYLFSIIIITGIFY